MASVRTKRKERQSDQSGLRTQSERLLATSDTGPDAPLASADAPRSGRALPVRSSIDVVEDSQESRRRRAVIIFAGILAAVALATTIGGGPPPRPSSTDLHSLGNDERPLAEVLRSRRPETFEERVHRHKVDTGIKLNRQRIAVQFENMQTSRPDGRYPPAPRRDPLLHGVPLQAEKNPYSQPDGSVMLNGPDEQVTARLQEQRDERLWERRAREQYVKDFISNARAMGYEVKIDQDYNVEYQPISDRAPNSVAPRRAGPGAAD